MSLLRPGIGSGGKQPLSNFKTACYEVERTSGGKLSTLRSPDVTPNFFWTTLDRDGEEVAIVCNSAFPVVAFADPTVRDFPYVLAFRECSDLAATFVRHGYRCPPVDELQRSLNDADTSALNEFERKSMKYWKPKTVGEIVFNHWD